MATLGAVAVPPSPPSPPPLSSPSLLPLDEARDEPPAPINVPANRICKQCREEKPDDHFIGVRDPEKRVGKCRECREADKLARVRFLTSLPTALLIPQSTSIGAALRRLVNRPQSAGQSPEPPRQIHQPQFILPAPTQAIVAPPGGGYPDKETIFIHYYHPLASTTKRRPPD